MQPTLSGRAAALGGGKPALPPANTDFECHHQPLFA
jgi:hypothetical protein